MQAHTRLSFLVVTLTLGVSCAGTVRHQRVVVTAAHAPEDAREPIAGAAVRVECPEGVTPPAASGEVVSNARGEAFLTVGAISSACFLVVASDGYITQRFRVGDICLVGGEEPFLCKTGVAFAPLMLDGPWNNADAGAAAAALSNECFLEPGWAGDSTPSVRLERVINKTDEHINLRAVSDQILAVAVKSPRIRVLDARGVGDSGPGADFHLVLDISSITTVPREGILARAYSTTARVIRAADQEIVCQATSVRKKQQLRTKTTW